MSQIVTAGDAKDQGNAAFTSGDFQTAISFYTLGISLINDQPDTEDILPTLYSNRAMSYIKMSQFDAGLADCETALTTNNLPNTHKMFVKLSYRKGHCLMHLKKTDDAKKLYNSILSHTQLDKSTRTLIEKDLAILNKPKISLQQQEMPTNMTMADLQRLAAQQQAPPNAAQLAASQNTAKKPLGGVWGRGGGKALSSKVMTENNGAPIHIGQGQTAASIAAAAAAKTTTTTTSAGPSREEQIQKATSQFVEKFNTNPATTIDDNGYYGEFDIKKREWRNKSMKPRSLDIPTTDFDSASEGENDDYSPDADYSVTQAEMAARRDAMKKVNKENKVKDRIRARQEREENVTNKNVYDGALTFLRQAKVSDSAMILCRTQFGMLMLGKKLKKKIPTADDTKAAEELEMKKQKLLETDADLKRMIDSLGGSGSSSSSTDSTDDNNNNSNPLINNNIQPQFKAFQKFRWSIPSFGAEEFLKKFYTQDLIESKINTRPTSSDLAIAAIYEMFNEYPEIYPLLKDVVINKLCGIEEYPSLQYPRRMRYIIDLSITFNDIIDAETKLTKFINEQEDNDNAIIKIIPYNILEFNSILPMDDYEMLTIIETLRLNIDNNTTDAIVGVQPTPFTTLTTNIRKEFKEKYNINIKFKNKNNNTDDNDNDDNDNNNNDDDEKNKKIALSFFPTMEKEQEITTPTTYPFSTVELLVLSKSPDVIGVGSNDDYAILLVPRLQNDNITYELGLPITQIDDSDSVSFTSTRLLHNLYGLLADSWSLVDLNTTTSYITNTTIQNIPAQDKPLVFNGTRFITSTLLYGKQHKTTTTNYSKFWPSRTKSAQVDYEWLTLTQLITQLKNAETTNNQKRITFYRKLIQFIHYAMKCEEQNVQRKKEQEEAKQAKIDAAGCTDDNDENAQDNSKTSEPQEKEFPVPFGLGALLSTDTIQKAQNQQ